MADEITISASMSYEDSENTSAAMSVVEALFSVATKRIQRCKMNVAITEEAIPLGDVTAPGYAFFINRDTTNFINLKVATSGAIFAKLTPDTNGDGKGGFAILRLGSGAQAPFAIADTATCQMDIFIIST